LYYFTQHLKYNPRANHTLIIGPYDDAGLKRGQSPVVPGFQADAAAQVDLNDLRYQWLDHVFKGAALPLLVKDRVNYQVMGANEWRHAPSLDALDQELRRFYLDMIRAGTGRALATRKPSRLQFAEQVVSFADRSDAARVPSTDITAKMPAMHNGLMFSSDPLAKDAEFAGRFSGRLDLTLNKMDVDLEISLYEQTAAGETVRLFSPASEFRASYVREREHRHLLKAGMREELMFRSERMTSRRLKAGSRLVIVLAIAKRPDREINYGTGNDVSEESLSDGNIPLKIRWYNDSYIEVPMGR
jgi:predicted acyl esterase